MSDEQDDAVEELQEAISESLLALKRCTETGLSAGDAVRACGISWPQFADVALDSIVKETPTVPH